MSIPGYTGWVSIMTIGVGEFWAFALIFTRISTLFVAAPLFSSAAIPRPLKVGLAGLLAISLTPMLAPRLANVPSDIISLVTQIAAEAAVGLTLGFIARMIFAAIEVAGSFLDLQIGFSMMRILDPINGQQTAVIGSFMSQLGLTLFLIAGGHLFLIGSVAGSYGVIAPGAAHFAGNGPDAITHVAGQMLTLAFRIALPATAILLIVDVSFAIIARTVPQMNIMIVGMPLKIMVGLFTVGVVLPAVALVIGQMTPAIGTGMQAFLQAAR
jgi:flagellar biosynthesis protein FliR